MAAHWAQCSSGGSAASSNGSVSAAGFPASPQQLDRAQNWFQHYGVWSLLLTWIPGLGDGLTVAAGVMRVGIVPFCVVVAIGRGLRYAAIVLVLNGVVLPWFAD